MFAGTSGFSYANWKGVFYPANLAGSRMLTHYSERLRGVELNGSFYRMPLPSALAKWASAAPPGFLYCLKAHRGLTYSADAFDRVGLARLFGERLTVLGQHLGPILLQFPPVRKFNPALLDSLLSALGLPAACEFRDASWLRDETYALLRSHGAALVVTDEEKWPCAPLLALAPHAYFRLRRGYTTRTLKPWLQAIAAARSSHDFVHVYFKHDPGAPALALKVARLSGRFDGLRVRLDRPVPMGE